jgi:hypothetical protein
MQNTTWKSIALVLAGIILGCGANAIHGAQAQPTFAPNPAATKWQQYCAVSGNVEEANQRAEGAGEQGFELVGVSKVPNYTAIILCFNRPAA